MLVEQALRLRPHGSVSIAGGDRRAARPGRHCGGDRLAADRRALRKAAGVESVSGDRAESCGGRRDERGMEEGLERIDDLGAPEYWIITICSMRPGPTSCGG